VTAEQIEKNIKDRIAEIDAQVATFQAERAKLAAMAGVPAVPAKVQIQPIYISYPWYVPPSPAMPPHDWWTQPWGTTICTTTLPGTIFGDPNGCSITCAAPDYYGSLALTNAGAFDVADAVSQVVRLAS
jgi:hypothetical protein